MSVWAEVSGSIRVPSDSHFSLKKSIQGRFEAAKPAVKQYHSDKIEVKFSFVEDGLCAAKQISDWVDSLPKGSKVDLEASIRFLR